MQEATTDEIQALEKVKEKCLKCDKCPLGKTRTNTVFSGGVPNHKLMLIGEAPDIMKIRKANLLSAKQGSFLIKFLPLLDCLDKKMFISVTLLNADLPITETRFPKKKKLAENILMHK